MSRNVRLAVVLVTTLVLQTVVFDALTILGVRLDLWIVVTVAAGLAAGPDRGALVGFLCGLAFDLTQPGPAGLGALLYTLAGYLVGTVQRSVVGPARWVPVLAATATALVTVAAYIVLGVVLGHHEWITTRMITVVLVVTAGVAVLTPVAVRIMAWTEGEPIRAGGGRARRSASTRRGLAPGVR